MSGEEAKVKDTPSSAVTAEPSMTDVEALAIAWTGIEVLAKMHRARLFQSPKTGRVWVEFSQTEYDPANGLKVLAVEKKDET